LFILDFSVPYLLTKEKAMTLGERIKMLCEKRGLGVRELARKADVKHTTLSQLERGIRADVGSVPQLL
jgi:transcriptional regulator with XRE-family HTH domain